MGSCSIKEGAKLPTEDVTLGKSVHLMDIHLEKGMACADCHFTQDVHGNGKLYRRDAQCDRDWMPGTATAPSTARRC